MTWFADPVSLNLVWLAGFKPSDLPWPQDAPPVQDIKPSNSAKQWAIKLDTVRDNYEGSLSYFDGYDVLPSAAFISAAAPNEIFLAHDRIKVLGGDFAAPVGRFVMRGEVAHTDTEAPQDGAVFSLRPQTYAVAGGEHTFGEYLNVNVQYYYRRVDGSAVPSGQPAASETIGEQLAVNSQQFDRTDHGFTFPGLQPMVARDTRSLGERGFFHVARGLHREAVDQIPRDRRADSVTRRGPLWRQQQDRLRVFERQQYHLPGIALGVLKASRGPSVCAAKPWS